MQVLSDRQTNFLKDNPDLDKFDQYRDGGIRLIWGFAKKLLLADMLASYVSAVFQHYAEYAGITVLIGAFFYSVQICADFPGYMDIVCGLCQMLGIRLAESFNRPYFSKSVAEYWRRWHITLGAWFKTYLYYPVAVSKRNQKLGKCAQKRFAKYIGRTLPATLALLLSVILLFAIYTAPYFYGKTYPYQDSKARDALAGQLDLLISGLSHAFRAFIPEQIDRAFGTNSYNLAYSMQTMQGRYFLLKKEMERNPVKTVLIEVSYNSLTRNRKSEGPEGDIYELGRLAAPIERWSFFFSSISPSEYGKLYYDTIDRSTTARKAILRGETGSAQDSVRGYGGMAPVDQTLSPEKYAEAYHSRSIVTEQDAYDIFYFEKCPELCREKNVRVILVTTPMPKKTLLSFDRLETVRLWYEEYAARFCCEFYDFNLLKSKAADYPESTAYIDETHLSSIGAQTFSEDLCEVLKKTENGASVEGLFYGNYDEMVEMLLRK